MLAQNSYGKSGIRLVHRSRRGDRYEIRDLTIAVALEGDYEAAHVEGDNSRVLPTDTMKNTVYGLARSRGIGAIESFGLLLADHFLGASEAASAVRVSISERPWERLPQDSGLHPSAFSRPSSVSTSPWLESMCWISGATTVLSRSSMRLAGREAS